MIHQISDYQWENKLEPYMKTLGKIIGKNIDVGLLTTCNDVAEYNLAISQRTRDYKRLSERDYYEILTIINHIKDVQAKPISKKY